MSSPFSYNDLIFRSLFLSGVTELLSKVPIDIRLQSAQEVEDEYSFWNEEQGFGSSDFTFAIQRYLDNMISYSGLSYRTQFNPCLEVVEITDTDAEESNVIGGVDFTDSLEKLDNLNV
jgi:hypothetical protein